jgi:hypothetical protein
MRRRDEPLRPSEVLADGVVGYVIERVEPAPAR